MICFCLVLWPCKHLLLISFIKNMATGKVSFSRNWFKFNYRENLKEDSWQTLILLRFTISMVSGQLLPVENCLLVTVAIWVKVRVSFRLGGNQAIAPEEKCPRLMLGFGLELVLGWGQFSSGAIVLESTSFIIYLMQIKRSRSFS